MRDHGLSKTHQPGMAAGVLIAGLAVSGCASNVSHPAATASTRSTAHSSSAFPSSNGPGAVAIRYTHDIAAGDAAGARALMAPDSVRAFDVITASAPKRSSSSRDLGIGHLTRAGTHADVLLTGTLCLSAQHSSCISNTSATPTRANLPFLVHLQLHGADWLVTFPRPGQKQ